MDPRHLFLETLVDLERQLASRKPYDLLRASALLRQLLLESHPLVDQANRELRVKVRYAVIPYDPPPFPLNIHISPAVVTDDFPNGPSRELVVRSAFLAAVLGQMNGEKITTQAVILHAAHVLGGVHIDRPENADAQVLVALNRAFSLGGTDPTLQLIAAIGRGVLKALQPLRDAVTASLSASR